MDIPTLRAMLPEFADGVKFPDIAIQGWLNAAAVRLDVLVWGPLLDEGLMYFAAHNLKTAQLAARPGGSGVSQVISSKSVGPASVSYDNNFGTIPGAGAYNLSIYGREFWQLCLIVGAGGVQLNPIGAASLGIVGGLGGSGGLGATNGWPYN